MKNITHFRKRVKPVWIRAWKSTEQSSNNRGQLLCTY